MKTKALPKPRPRRVPATLQHQVRIIGGNWKRTPLPVLAAEGLRPTPDRVRETVFNWLTHLLDGRWEQVRCLDLFAGTGALGFEAASRGAVAVTMVEVHTPAVRQLEATRDRLQASGITILRGDAATVAQSLTARSVDDRFDLIFLDPPYRQDWLPKMLPLCRRLLAPGGLVYAEAETLLAGTADVVTATDVRGANADLVAADAVCLDGWQVVRADRAGTVFYHLLQCETGAGVEA